MWAEISADVQNYEVTERYKAKGSFMGSTNAKLRSLRRATTMS